MTKAGLARRIKRRFRKARREEHPDSCAHDRIPAQGDAAEQDSETKPQLVLIGFLAVYVSDVAQTEGEDRA